MHYDFANIEVRPFLKLSDVNNPYIFGETKHVINMCDYREPEVIDLIYAKGGTFDWFPTGERPMDVELLLNAVAKLAEYDKDGGHIIVHCMGGNNRSRTVVEAFHYIKTGAQFNDEYKGYPNHLLYNCGEGYLPPFEAFEKLLINTDTNMEEKKKKIERQKQDLLMVSAFNVQPKRGKTESVVYDMLDKRAAELVEKVHDAVVEALNDPKLVIPELDNIEVEPGNNLCKDFPADIFNYTDRLTLLNEGYAIYAEPDDKDKIEDKLKDIIRTAVDSLPKHERDILYCSTDLHESPIGMPWYEWDIFSDLQTGVDYKGTMEKVDEYNEQCRWYAEDEDEEEIPVKEEKDYHQGILDCHQLFTEIYNKRRAYDPELTNVFGRLVMYEIMREENPAPYFAELQKEKTYREAVDDCYKFVTNIYDSMSQIDKDGDIRHIAFDFREKAYRMLACYLYNIIFAKKKGATFQKERCTNFRHKQRQKAANNSKKVAAFFIFKGRLKTFQKAFRLSIAKL